jgi:hypothetical protein
MSKETEALLGLPDLSKLFDAIRRAEELFGQIQEYIAKAKAFYEANKADIDALIAVIKRVIEFLRNAAGSVPASPVEPRPQF